MLYLNVPGHPYHLKIFLRGGIALWMILACLSAVESQLLSSKLFTPDDGVPSEYTLPLFCDRLGFVWFGTTEGIVAYDGNQFTNFGRSEHFMGDAVTGLEDTAGTLWFGGNLGLKKATRSALLPLKLQFQEILDRQGKPFSEVYMLLRSGQGTVFFIAQKKLFEVRGDSILPLVLIENQPVGLGNPVVQQGTTYTKPTGPGFRLLGIDYAFIDSRDNLWMIDSGKLYIGRRAADFATDTLVVRELFAGRQLAEPNSVKIGEARDHAILILLDERHLLFAGQDSVVGQIDLTRYSPKGMNDFCLESGNVMWMVSGNRLFRAIIRPASSRGPGLDVQQFQKNSQLPANTGNSDLILDGESNLWFHSRFAGVVRINTRGFILYPHDDLGLDHVDRVFESSRHTFFARGDGTVAFRFDTTHSIQSSLRAITTRMRYARSSEKPIDLFQWNGDTLLGIGHGGALTMGIEQEGRPLRFHAMYMRMSDRSDHPILHTKDELLCAFKDREGFLWLSANFIGVVKGVVYRDTFIVVKSFSYGDGVGFHSTRAIVQTRDGSLWFGGFLDGLTRLAGTSVANFTTADGLTDNAIRVLHESKDGHLWVGTRRGGMCVYRDGTFSEYPSYPALRTNTVWAIAEDSSERIWIGTEQGLKSFIPPASLQREAEVLHYDQRKGIPKERVSDVFLGNANRLYCATIKGVYVTTLPDLLQEASSSRLYLNSIRVNGIELERGENFDFAPSENTISVGYRVLNQAGSGASLYRYKLEGWMKDWSSPTTLNEVTFVSLSPGNYTMKVQLIPVNGMWEAEQLSDLHKVSTTIAVRFSIAAPFWRTWWFAGIVIAAILSALFALYRYRVRQVLMLERIRIEEHERVRKKTAADFHDEFGHRLTKISLFSEILKTKSDSPELSGYLEKIRENAQTMYQGVRDFIWTLDPQKDSLLEVAERLRDFGTDLYDKTDIEFRVRGITDDFENVRLSMDWRRHLVLIFKEAMTNALKHAHCSNVQLEFEKRDSLLHVRLHDDGKGIAPGGDESGNGLHNMQMRAVEVKGTLSIVSNERGGTDVIFESRIP